MALYGKGHDFLRDIFGTAFATKDSEGCSSAFRLVVEIWDRTDRGANRKMHILIYDGYGSIGKRLGVHDGIIQDYLIQCFTYFKAFANFGMNER